MDHKKVKELLDLCFEVLAARRKNVALLASRVVDGFDETMAFSMGYGLALACEQNPDLAKQVFLLITEGKDVNVSKTPRAKPSKRKQCLQCGKPMVRLGVNEETGLGVYWCAECGSMGMTKPNKIKQ